MDQEKSPTRVYLACPYWHWLRFVRVWRYKKITKIAGRLMQFGYIVFSPITHSHPIAETMPKSWHTHENWLNQDKHYLDWADAIFVVKLRGWEKSFGVTWEINYMRDVKKQVFFVDPKSLSLSPMP